jgi:predicted  nucleic acid-binding Zn-ribbon protein
MDDFDNERTSVQQQVTTYQSQIDDNQAKINTMENMIQSVDLKIAEHERVIIDVVREIKDIEIALGAATTTQDMEMLNQKWNGLANDKWDLNQQIKQLRDEKFQLRNYSQACFTKSERLSVAMTALEISRQSTGELTFLSYHVALWTWQ